MKTPKSTRKAFARFSDTSSFYGHDVSELQTGDFFQTQEQNGIKPSIKNLWSFRSAPDAPPTENKKFEPRWKIFVTRTIRATDRVHLDCRPTAERYSRHFHEAVGWLIDLHQPFNSYIRATAATASHLQRISGLFAIPMPGAACLASDDTVLATV